jgi:hypothetical protein
MRSGSFSVLIDGGEERSNSQVFMRHNSQFRIRIGNHGSKRCDATLQVDGKTIMTLRLAAGQVTTVDGPPDGDRGNFTFLATNTEAAAACGASEIKTDDRGLIEVKFVPEKVRTYRPIRKRYVGYNPDDGAKWISSHDDLGGVIRTQHLSSGPRGQSASDFGTTETSCDFDDTPVGGAPSSSFLTRSPQPETQAGIVGLTGEHSQKWIDAGHMELDYSSQVDISLRLVEPVNRPSEQSGPRPLQPRTVPPVASNA